MSREGTDHNSRGRPWQRAMLWAGRARWRQCATSTASSGKSFSSSRTLRPCKLSRSMAHKRQQGALTRRMRPSASVTSTACGKASSNPFSWLSSSRYAPSWRTTASSDEISCMAQTTPATLPFCRIGNRLATTVAAGRCMVCPSSGFPDVRTRLASTQSAALKSASGYPGKGVSPPW